MKRGTAFLLVCCLLCGLCCLPAAADDESNTVQYFEDGSRLVTTILPGCVDDGVGWHNESMEGGGNCVTRSMTRIYYDADNHADWKVVLTATFRPGLLRAVCVDYETKYKIYDHAWYCADTRAEKRANTCKAVFTLCLTAAGAVVHTTDVTLQLVCDRKGNVTAEPQKNALDLGALRRWLLSLRRFFVRFFAAA